MADPLRVLSLFSGIGGLDLGFHAAARRVDVAPVAVGYVEREALCAAVLACAMEVGDLAPAPLFVGDVREFPAEDLARAVDVVLAGFPCPPVSAAGKRGGIDDERWLWPEVVRVARESRARYIAIENPVGILTSNGGREWAAVLGSLAEGGFSAECTSVSASDVGAPHGRARVFLLAHAQDDQRWTGERGEETGTRAIERGRRGSPSGGVALADAQVLRRAEGRPEPAGEQRGPDAAECGDGVADAPCERAEPEQLAGCGRGLEPSRERLADAGSSRRQTGQGAQGWEPVAPPRSVVVADTERERPQGLVSPGPAPRPTERGGGDWPLPWPPGFRGDDDRWAAVLGHRPDLAPRLPTVAALCDLAPGVPPGLVRAVEQAMSDRTLKLRALGNAIAPAQAEAAFLELLSRGSTG